MTDIINSIDRALDILICLYNNGQEMGISEIGRELDVYKSTVHRTLATLENRGFVYQNKENGKYWLGIKIYAMGLLVGEKLSIFDAFKPYTKKLHEEFNEVVNVSILDKNSLDGYKSMLVVKEADEKKVLSVNPNIGSSIDAHCSSVGKTLLAFSKDIDLEQYADKPLKRYTENTIVTWDGLIKELEEIRRKGYAIDEDEQEIGLTCIGAPIIDKYGNAIAAISMSGPTQRMRSGDFYYKVKRVIEIAKEISDVLK